jgi:hypothetical protein
MLIDIVRRGSSATPFSGLFYITFSSVNYGTSTVANTTFSSVALGTPHTNRRIVVVVHLFSNSADRTVGGVIVAGVSASAVIVPTTSSLANVGIFLADVPTGTIGNIEILVSGGAYDSVGIGVYSLVTANATAVATAQNQTNNTGTKSVTLNTANNGVVIAGSQSVNGSSSTWTNAIGLYSTDMRSGEWANGAVVDRSNGSSLTVTSTSARSLAAASWQIT